MLQKRLNEHVCYCKKYKDKVEGGVLKFYSWIAFWVHSDFYVDKYCKRKK